MSVSWVEVSTPSRLHCGMLAFGEGAARQFGGLGIMIDRPRVRLRLSAAERLHVDGPLADRVQEFARLATTQADGEPCAAIKVLGAPPSHVGLGSGTQLALAVAAGMAAIEGLPYDNVIELGQRVGRGKRSSVGMHGFAAGGLILEGGKRGSSDFGPLLSRVVVPEQWRFVLLLPRDGSGLSGAAEVQAMAALPSVPQETTAEMCRVLMIELLPAAVEADFDTFADRLECFGRLAGECFSSVQGGPYARGPAAESVVMLREAGGRGIAQSSWGPGVFCVCTDEVAAEELRGRLAEHAAMAAREIVIAGADNQGATVRVGVDNG